MLLPGKRSNGCLLRRATFLASNQALHPSPRRPSLVSSTLHLTRFLILIFVNIMCDLKFNLQLRLRLKRKQPNEMRMGNFSCLLGFVAFLYVSLLCSRGNLQNLYVQIYIICIGFCSAACFDLIMGTVTFLNQTKLVFMSFFSITAVIRYRFYLRLQHPNQTLPEFSCQAKLTSNTILAILVDL